MHNRINKIMRYTIYKTTNLLNEKIYIGKHQTKNPNDSYLGSGRYLIAAIKKAGRENFKKEVLFDFDTEAEMNAKEIELIDKAFVSRSDTYNIGVGGEGGPQFKGRKHSEQTILRLSEQGHKLTPTQLQSRLDKNLRHSEESKNKISQSMKGRRLSYETKKKISDSIKSRVEKIRSISLGS